MFEWLVTINLYDREGKVIRVIEKSVYAATLHDAKGRADKIGAIETEKAQADFWTVQEVI